MKTADQILPAAEIHAGLAAHRGIHLRQQCSGYLNHRNAAHEHGREESAHVIHDAAAHGNHDAGPVRSSRHHLFRKLLQRGKALVHLAAREEQKFMGWQ